MPGFACAICLVRKGQVVVGDAAFFCAALSGFAAFAVVDIQRHILAGVKIESAIITFATIKEKLVITHNCYVFYRAVYRYNLGSKWKLIVPSQHSVDLCR